MMIYWDNCDLRLYHCFYLYTTFYLLLDPHCCQQSDFPDHSTETMEYQIDTTITLLSLVTANSAFPMTPHISISDCECFSSLTAMQHDSFAFTSVATFLCMLSAKNCSSNLWFQPKAFLIHVSHSSYIFKFVFRKNNK